MDTFYYSKFNFAPIGRIIIASCQESLVYLSINAEIDSGLKFCNNDFNNYVINQLNEYLSGKRILFDLNTKFFAGTEFQQKVWHELANIPYGQTISYKELAQRIGQASAIRAVGKANSKNHIAIIFPCHRVINADGKLGGFSGGIQAKKFLINLESSNIPVF